MYVTKFNKHTALQLLHYSFYLNFTDTYVICWHFTVGNVLIKKIETVKRLSSAVFLKRSNLVLGMEDNS